MFLPAQPQDFAFMERAVHLAQATQYRTSPNPSVGCVLVKNGVVIGEGATQAAGGDHGEIDALKNAAKRGFDPRGATAYVTLEPCNHTGRTGPCSSALLAAGVARVVAALEDPNPLTAGAGLRRLQSGGVQVTVGVAGAQAASVVMGFLKRMATGLPWVRLKVAASLDGFVALPNGQSQWLTGLAARRDGHYGRACACAVVTGSGTVLADNPRLDVRLFDTPRQPLRVVLDTQLRTPPSAALFAVPTPILLLHACDDAVKISALQAAGAQLEALPKSGNHLNLRAALQALGARGLNTLHLECGGRLNGAFLAAGLVDEIVLYQAPMLLGAGLTWASSQENFTHLDPIPRLGLQSVQRLADPSEQTADTKLVLHTPHTFQWSS